MTCRSVRRQQVNNWWGVSRNPGKRRHPCGSEFTRHRNRPSRGTQAGGTRREWYGDSADRCGPGTGGRDCRPVRAEGRQGWGRAAPVRCGWPPHPAGPRFEHIEAQLGTPHQVVPEKDSVPARLLGLHREGHQDLWRRERREVHCHLHAHTGGSAGDDRAPRLRVRSRMAACGGCGRRSGVSCSSASRPGWWSASCPGC